MRILARALDVLAGTYRTIKRPIIRSKFKRVGKRFRFDPDGVYLGAHLMEFGDDVFIGRGAYFSAEKGISLGDSVMLGPYITIIGGDHNFTVVGKRMADVHEGGVNKPVLIGDDVWVGARVLILKGVTIGEGSIVGAGSVVTKDIPPYVVAFGNPCKVIRARFNKQELIEHLGKVGSTLDCSEVLDKWSRDN